MREPQVLAVGSVFFSFSRDSKPKLLSTVQPVIARRLASNGSLNNCPIVAFRSANVRTFAERKATIIIRGSHLIFCNLSFHTIQSEEYGEAERCSCFLSGKIDIDECRREAMPKVWSTLKISVAGIVRIQNGSDVPIKK